MNAGLYFTHTRIYRTVSLMCSRLIRTRAFIAVRRERASQRIRGKLCRTIRPDKMF